MYFSYVPDLKYDIKPYKFPFTQTDYVTVKNFFRRYKVNEDMFSYVVFFTKYSITDSDRIDLLAERAYGSPYYDWVIAILNNIINPTLDWPMTEWQLRKHVDQKYDYPDAVHHYETKEVRDSANRIVLKEGLIVDEKFYNAPYKYYDSNEKRPMVKYNINDSVTFEVSNFKYEEVENEKKREIYLLKGNYFDSFVSEFRKLNMYSKSSDYISSQLKKTG
jgi:hypothetical protein